MCVNWIIDVFDACNVFEDLNALYDYLLLDGDIIWNLFGL